MRVSRSILGPDEIAAVVQALETGFLGQGEGVARFEAELADQIGGGVEVVCVNSGTAALHVALQACGIGPGDEVLVPALTFVACFQAIEACGARPVICDVRQIDGLLDLEDAARRSGSNTRAVMPVHYGGNPALCGEVYDWAVGRGLRVVEDAAHAFGGSWEGGAVGRGGVVCFSFDGIKNITSGEGGAVVLEEGGVAARCRAIRRLGIDGDDVEVQGWRYHMSEVMAAIGRVQLRRLGEFSRARRALSGVYRARLGALTDVRCVLPDLDRGIGAGIVPHIFPVAIEASRREAVRDVLGGAGIETRVHYKPGHMWRRWSDGQRRPVAEGLYGRLLTLPLHPGLEAGDVGRVCDVIEGALKG